MSAEVIENRRSRSAIIVTEGSQQDDMLSRSRWMIGPTGRGGRGKKQASVEHEVSCSPPIGSRIFW